MSDVEKSFKFLEENVPQWLQDITRIEERVNAMQECMAKMPVSTSPFALRKTGSIESIREGKLGPILENKSSSQAAQTEPIGLRKRKTTSMLSGPASGPSRYRQRTMVVVDYDGNLQKSFEDLVRGIGTGRNMLRKAKMEARMNAMAALNDSSEDEETLDLDNDDILTTSNMFRPRMSAMRTRAAARRGSSSNAPIQIFETTDKTLELAQELCEKAAHLVLREGDCRKELQGTRKNFENVLNTAKTEVDRCHTRKPDDQHETLTQDTSDTSISSMDEPPVKPKEPEVSMPAPEPGPDSAVLDIGSPSKTAVTAEPKIMDLEIDEDQEEEEEQEFVMPPIRLTSRFGPRS